MWFLWLVIGLLLGHYVITDVQKMVERRRIIQALEDEKAELTERVSTPFHRRDK